MNDQSINNNNTNPVDDVIDFKAWFSKFVNNWAFFLISVVVFSCLAFLFMTYVPPSYNITSKVLVDQENSSSQSAGGGAATLGIDFSSIFGLPSNAENEVDILQSRNLMYTVINKMKLNVTVYSVQAFNVTSELFNEAPFDVDVKYRVKVDSIITRKYYVKFLTADQYEITNSSEDVDLKVKFGDSIKLEQFKIVLNKKPGAKIVPGLEYKIKIQPPGDKYDELSKSYDVELSDKQSTTIDLTLPYSSPEKGEAILQTLMNVYIKNNLDNKVQIADSTIKFIDGRLDSVFLELKNVEDKLQDFQKKNNFADPTDQSKALVTEAAAYYDKLNTIDVQLAIVNDLEKYIKNSNNKTIIPNTLSVQDPVFAATIEQYNQLLVDRGKLELSYKADNPVLKNTNDQIESARANLEKSFYIYKNGLLTSRTQLVNQNKFFDTQLKSAPATERIFLDYTRTQNLQQTLYLYLLQKKEETEISKTSTVSDSRVIDPAKSDYKPSFPKPAIIYVAGLFLGMLFPMGFLFFKEILKINL